MSYTAPSGSAVDFTFDGTSYTAPVGDSVDFSFSSEEGAAIVRLGNASALFFIPLARALRL